MRAAIRSVSDIYESNLRSGAPEGAAVVLREGGEVTIDRSAPADLAWYGVEDADRYTVRIFDAGGRAVWSGDSREPRITVPVGATALLESGVEYDWSVEANLPFGDPVRSRLGTIRVR